MDFFSKNLKFLRRKEGLSVEALGEKLKINPSTIYRWENGSMGATIKTAYDIAMFFDITIADLIGIDLANEYLKQYNDDRTSLIPVLGVIKAGVPIEAQEDVLEYIDMPIKAFQGGRKYFALKISGDSMENKYQDGDIVVIEQTSDLEKINNKDCVVMVNTSDATFKHITVTDDGVVLNPLNPKYSLKFYTKEQVATLPVIVLGVAVEKRVKL